MWAVSNILIPAFQANGYSPPWPEPSADPTDPSSDFREYIDWSMHYILAAGFAVTNDLAAIDAYSSDLAAAIYSDGLESANTLGWRYVGPGGLVITPAAAVDGAVEHGPAGEYAAKGAQRDKPFVCENGVVHCMNLTAVCLRSADRRFSEAPVSGIIG